MFLKDLNASQRKAWKSLKIVPTITELTLRPERDARTGHPVVTGKRSDVPFEYVLTAQGYINLR